MVVNLCSTFHCPPSQLNEEEADLIRIMEIIRLGTKEEED
jgi:hypothetical protein